jgi:cytoskeletal protein RodZ
MVGEQLREARQAQNLSIQQVADITKIRGDHIRALEEGDYEVFSAPVYIRGFVRAYSGLVKLDPVKVIAELEKELGQRPKFSELPGLSQPPRTFLDVVMLQMSRLGLRKGAVIAALLIAVLVTVMLVSAWKRRAHGDPLARLQPGIYQPTQALPGETLPIPTPAKK